MIMRTMRVCWNGTEYSAVLRPPAQPSVHETGFRGCSRFIALIAKSQRRQKRRTQNVGGSTHPKLLKPPVLEA